MTLRHESSFVFLFHSCSSATVNFGSFESMAWAHVEHSQIPLSAEMRSLGVMLASWRGPPGAAAQMCAASPMLISPWPSDDAAWVRRRHPGFEQWPRACRSIRLRVAGVKLSLLLFLAIRARLRGLAAH